METIAVVSNRMGGNTTPNVENSQELCRLFLAGLEKEYSSNRVELHISDLIYCLKDAFFSRALPKPPDIISLNYFVDGANRHLSLQSISGLKREVKLEKYGVIGSLDLMGLSGEPIEIKTTRATQGISAHYLRQLGYYCIIAGKDTGHLVIQRILNRNEPWEWYRIKYTSEEISQLDYELQRDANLLRQAINVFNNSKPEWYPGIALETLQATLKDNAIKACYNLPRTRYGWKCGNCRYYHECRTPQPSEQEVINERIKVFAKQIKEGTENGN